MDAASAVSTCAMALPLLARSSRAERFLSGNQQQGLIIGSQGCSEGKGVGGGEQAHALLAQSANYIIGTKEKIGVTQV